MAPIRRYLRITKHSALECRIYLDNPSDSRWLLSSAHPVLPRVFDAIRHLVLPKLREENIRLWTRKKGKPVKDVVQEDDFEVAIFLRETRTRHSLLTRTKTFHNSGKGSEAEHDEGSLAMPANSVENAQVIPESDSDPEFDLHDIPANEDGTGESDLRTRRGKGRDNQDGQAEGTDEKKLGFSTTYESFNIHGWVLCLLITRKDGKAGRATTAEPKQPLMEEWISTQAQTTLEED
ncbi:hypothetical protein N7468_004077 [Penicillium chermesinum]|uniref:Uncharacterized protein n=1 Tax=Penicillium chermesinum TaxID=63820 RepID=A0A9W9PA86_9EURO|nr:uncharacterized protein N7468_004077 [Penicillium chermesinum]KAJ5239458.1 hypothetical protein N7468_004077 [Penicillium chermesinum]KAJ6141283.1 hypothetical protein N7470_010179 [Penicillium chermesinum]